MDNYIYLGITVVSIVFTAGMVMGIIKMSLGAITEKLEHMGDQIKEVRDDQKTISELSTRMAVVEEGIKNVVKCQDHLQTDMTLLKKRNTRKIED